MTTIEDEQLGRIVRAAWVAWAKEQLHAKPSWLTDWDQLDEGQREVDIRIGRAVAAQAAYNERARIRGLLPYNVNCCEGFPAAVADLINEHEDSPALPDDGTAKIPQPTFTHRAYGVDVEWFGDEGGMIARGHVPELRFIAACNHMARAHTNANLANLWDDRSVTLDDALVEVNRCWALPVDPAEDYPGSEWVLRYDQAITEQTPGAIAVTILAP
jgi:hypothetical protein